MAKKIPLKDHNFFHVFAFHFMKKKFTMLRNFATPKKTNKK